MALFLHLKPILCHVNVVPHTSGTPFNAGNIYKTQGTLRESNQVLVTYQTALLSVVDS